MNYSKSILNTYGISIVLTGPISKPLAVFSVMLEWFYVDGIIKERVAYTANAQERPNTMKENESVQYINKTALLNELLYLKEAAKKVNPKETYILMAQERFIKDLDWFIEIVDNYPSPEFSLPRFLKEKV